MFAKTPYLHSGKTVKYEILELLIKSGAQINNKDIFGKTIIDYVRDAGDKNMEAYLINKSEQKIINNRASK